MLCDLRASVATETRMLSRFAILLTILLAAACSTAPPPPAGPAAGSGDAAFSALAAEILEDYFKRHPSSATDLGIHKYDAEMDDASAKSVADESAALTGFLSRLNAIDAATLSFDKQLDREQLVRAMTAGILANDVIRQWTKDPDVYSSGVTRAAYMIMKRKFAPPADRLKSLIAREQKMPAFLDEGRKNLDNPARIFTEIAIDQIDGNIRFFRDDVTAAFAEVTDKALLAEFARTNKAAMAALAAYKTFLQKKLLPKSKGSFAIGAETYAKALSANEMIDMPLDELLKIAEADRQRNEAAFQATARTMDATKTPEQVLASLQNDHPSAARAAQELPGHPGLDPPVHRRQEDHHDSPVRSGDRQGNAAVPAIDDVRVDGHARTVRDAQSSRRSTS